MPTADGRSVTMIHWDSGDVAVRDISTGEVKRLMLKKSWQESADYGEWPVLSRDQRQMAFAWLDAKQGRYQLRVAPNLAPAKARVLIDNPEIGYFRPAGWTADGASVIAVLWGRDNTTRIARVSTADGAVKVLRSLEWRDPEISVSPDGRYIAYDVLERPDSPARDIHVLAVDGSSDNIVVQNPGIDCNAAWIPDGSRLVFVSNRSGAFSLWSIVIHRGKAQGAAQLVKADMGRVTPKAFTSSGSLFYFQEHGNEDIYAISIASASAAKRARIVESYLGQNRGAVWSPDGKSVTYLSRRSGMRNGPGALTPVVRSLETGEEKTFPTSLNVAIPAWFHDGKSILLSGRDPQGRLSLSRVEVATGKISSLPVPEGRQIRFPGLLSPDDRTMYFTRDGDEVTPAALLAFDLASGQERTVYTGATRAYFSAAAMSRDGRKFAGVLVAADAREVVVFDADGKNVRTALHLPRNTPHGLPGGPNAIALSPNGSELYFTRFADDGSLVDVHQMAANASGTSTPMGIRGEALKMISLDRSGTKLAFTTGTPGNTELWALDNLFASAKTR
jgi:Tol biopolymer transport system component